MRKILCLIITMIMCMTSVIFPVSTVNAEVGNAERIFDKLDKLGIINGYELNDLELYEYVTRYEFLAALTNMTLEEGVSIAEYNEHIVDLAVSAGVVADKNDFRPDDEILLEEAVKMSVVMLGYGENAEFNGGYPHGHMQMAARLGVLGGVHANSGEMLNLFDMFCILDNVSEIPAMVQTTFGKTEDYVAYEDEGLLYIYRKIKSVEGIVTANAYTSLSGGTGAGSGRIVIDGQVYSYSGDDEGSLLGSSVEAYFREDKSGVDSVLYIRESDKNNTLSIRHSEEPSVSEDFGTLTYYPEDSDSEKKVKIFAAPSVIKNGVFYDGYTQSDFKLNSGMIELTDNNGDNVYDIIKITDYSTMFLASSPGKSDTLINLYSHIGTNQTLSVEDYIGDKFLKIDSADDSIYLSTMQKYDVLNVAMSEDERVLNIYVTRKSVTGTIAKLDSAGKYVTVGGADYRLSYAYKLAAEKGDIKAPQLKAGDKYTFYLDVFGEIAGVVSDNDSSYSYGYLTKYASDGIFDSTITLRMYTENDRWEEIAVAQKVRLNNESTISDDELTEKISNGGEVKPQLLSYKTNDSGQINEVRIAETAAYGRSDKYMCLEPVSGTYRQNNSSIDWGCFIEDDAIIWIVPSDVSNEDEFHLDSKANIFENSQSYTVIPYAVDEYNSTDKLVYSVDKLAEKEAETSNVFLVENTGEGYDSEGNIVKQLSGVIAGYPKMTISAAEESVFDGINKGDAIGFGASGSGKVKAVKKYYSPESGKTPFLVNGWHYSSSVAGGTVTALDLDYPRMKISSTSEKIVVLRGENETAATQVLIYNTERNIAQKGSLSDIMIGDFVVLRLVYSRVADLIIYR